MEHVLAVKSDLVKPFLAKKGLTVSETDRLLDIIRQNHAFLPRTEAERDPLHKQIIPYVLLRREHEVFATRRRAKGGEERLHGMLSLGLGGHISAGIDDTGGADALINGLWRELEEEAFIENPGALRVIGFINDDTSAVGGVHLGLFCVLDVTGSVTVRETDKLEGFWIKTEELPGLTGPIESWTELIISAAELWQR